MEQREETLIELGLPKNEAKVYLALVELGTVSIQDICTHTKIHRSNVYESTTRLEGKGLVAHIQKSKKKLYTATDPRNLQTLVDEKKQNLQKILPQLQLAHTFTQKSEALVHTGTKAFVNLLTNLLTYKKPITVYGIPKQAYEKIKTKIAHFHKKRTNSKVSMRHIYNFDAQKRIKELNSMKYTQAKFLPENIASVSSTTICGDEVLITTWGNTPVTIQIRSPEAAKSYKAYFEVLWKAAK